MVVDKLITATYKLLGISLHAAKLARRIRAHLSVKVMHSAPSKT